MVRGQNGPTPSNQAAALSENNKKIQSYIQLNLAGAKAIFKAESFQYTTYESREDLRCY